jgi:hypothetical protein
MLDNCTYNTVKLMHDLSGLAWYLKHFCQKDVKACRSKECQKLFMQIQKDLEKNIALLEKSLKK